MEVHDILTDTQSKSNPFVPSRGLMFPGPIAQSHPAGPMLREFGTLGCPVSISDKWSLEQLDQAVLYGAHPSASTPAAVESIRQETFEKVHGGFVRLVPWWDVRQLYLSGEAPEAKVSPAAAIPHKSRSYRLLLDLSPKGQRRRGQVPTLAVNDLTDQTAAPLAAMNNLGKVLPRVINTMATQPDSDGALMMCKLDIKDGFWRVCVPEKDELQFCYVLPTTNPNDPIMLVVPTALQMGWTSSPPFFCAATETGRDIADFLHKQPTLPPHPLEHHMMDPINPALLSLPAVPTHGPGARSGLFHLFEDYVDDYINIVQSTDPEVLRHASRAVLHAVHQIFPPPAATGHSGEDPISHKKLVVEGEGIWDTRKEILGWIFDGVARTMELPPAKVETMVETISSALRRHHVELKAFESLLGKLTHAMMGTPGGQALMPPLYKALAAANKSSKRAVQIHPNSPQAGALKDLRTLMCIISKRPVHCRQLVPGTPHYLGYSDACKFGAGGVWMSGLLPLRPLIWRVHWPVEFLPLFDTSTLTINDFEMAALLLGYLLLEQLVDLTHKHTGQWCDNSSTVSWVSHMSSKRSAVGQHLTRALALRYTTNHSSPLAPMPIRGIHNKMADLASRSFRDTGTAGNYNLTDHALLTKFNAEFPLTQEASWLMLRPSKKLNSLVFASLHGEPVPTGSWTRLPKYACDIGSTGANGAAPITWTPFSTELAQQHELCTSAISLLGCEKGMREEDIKSGLAQFRKRFAPSARPSNWLANPTPPMSPAPTKPSSTPSPSKPEAMSARTHHPSHS